MTTFDESQFRNSIHAQLEAHSHKPEPARTKDLVNNVLGGWLGLVDLGEKHAGKGISLVQFNVILSIFCNETGLDVQYSEKDKRLLIPES